MLEQELTSVDMHHYTLLAQLMIHDQSLDFPPPATMAETIPSLGVPSPVTEEMIGLFNPEMCRNLVIA